MPQNVAMSLPAVPRTDSKGPVPLVLRGRAFGGGRLPAVCVPLLSDDESALVAELQAVLREGPDVVEWRADYYGPANDPSSVVRAAARLRTELGERPLLFTLRAPAEGGYREVPMALDVYRAVCASRFVDAVDVEYSRPAEFLAAVTEVARKNGILPIYSCHDFKKTPGKAAMRSQLAKMAAAGAGAAKLAVMPQSPADVAALMEATREASAVSTIPVIAMSMGDLGVRSRVEGWRFGSALSFAAGLSASAPGQISVAALRARLLCDEDATSRTDNTE